MRFWCAVLIAAVTVNCLVTAINGKTAANKAIEPFNMLLPPLEDKPEDAVKTTKAPATTVAPRTTQRTTTTAKPLANKVNNVLPELSIEALLPPLYEAKIEKAEDEHKQQQTHPAQKTTPKTTTRAPTTTTRARATTTSTRRTTTTTTAATTARSVVAEPTTLFVDALLPPLSADSDTVSPTILKPKTTKKSFYQQQTQHLKDRHSIDASPIQSYNKGAKSSKDKQQKQFAGSKHVADTKSKPAPQHVISHIHQMTMQHVAKQVGQRKYTGSDIQYNIYGLDLYLGSTTPRPPKDGLPTITPFPHRLRR